MTIDSIIGARHYLPISSKELRQIDFASDKPICAEVLSSADVEALKEHRRIGKANSIFSLAALLRQYTRQCIHSDRIFGRVSRSAFDLHVD